MRAPSATASLMVDTMPDKVIAFIHNGSNGTRQCLTYARKRSLDVTVVELNH